MTSFYDAPDEATWVNFRMHAAWYAADNGWAAGSEWSIFEPHRFAHTPLYKYVAYWEVRHLLSPKRQKLLLRYVTAKRLGLDAPSTEEIDDGD